MQSLKHSYFLLAEVVYNLCGAVCDSFLLYAAEAVAAVV